MSGNAKRNLVVGTMAVLVCAAVGLNWKYSTELFRLGSSEPAAGAGQRHFSP